jgi:protein-S-isoprenylcysteine O-methyltransferase Ste14
MRLPITGDTEPIGTRRLSVLMDEDHSISILSHEGTTAAEGLGPDHGSAAALTEATLHTWLSQGLVVTAVITMAVLFVVSAPYGRHTRSGWGPRIPQRLAWMVMESPAVVGFGAIYCLGSHRAALVPLLLLGLWQVHYIHRTFIYPFRSPSRGTPWPVTVVVLGFAFQTLNSYLNARWISHLGTYDASWMLDARFSLGVALFGFGFVLNLWSDGVLCRLREPNDGGYRIPRGGAFEWVSCPNYLGEILEWIGWSIATWSLAGTAFALYTIANLGPRARSHHRWYLDQFDDYPKQRKALVPYVW